MPTGFIILNKGVALVEITGKIRSLVSYFCWLSVVTLPGKCRHSSMNRCSSIQRTHYWSCKRDRWYDFHIKLSWFPAQGYVRIWCYTMNSLLLLISNEVDTIPSLSFRKLWKMWNSIHFATHCNWSTKIPVALTRSIYPILFPS